MMCSHPYWRLIPLAALSVTLLLCCAKPESPARPQPRLFTSPAGNATARASTPTTYSRPTVITKGGTYSGHWESLDPRTPAVTIRTSEPVTLVNSRLRGRGDLIQTAVENARLTVRNCYGYGLNPNVAGKAPGRFVHAEYFSSIKVENNYLEGTSGIYLLNYRGDPAAGDSVKILGNRVHNIDGRKSDGQGGWLDYNVRIRLENGKAEEGFEIRQFLQVDKVRGVPGMEVAWNEVVNDPGASRVEDNINVYLSSGTRESPLLIHHNYIRGAYTIQPWQASYKDKTYSYDWSYSGGGILLGDGAAKVAAQASAYVRAYDNQVVSTTNYGIAIAAGHDNQFSSNRIVSSGLLPDGRAIVAQNVGAYIWDLHKAGPKVFYNNSGHNNTSGWIKAGGERNDWWMPHASSWANNVHWVGPINRDTEATEFATWRRKLTTAGRSVGPSP
jgi:hypothetical protein